jgi:formate dehydrogenase maturation protein FdhE
METKSRDRSMEASITESEDPPVCSTEPVATLVRGGHDTHNGALNMQRPD